MVSVINPEVSVICILGGNGLLMETTGMRLVSREPHEKQNFLSYCHSFKKGLFWKDLKVGLIIGTGLMSALCFMLLDRQ